MTNLSITVIGEMEVAHGNVHHMELLQRLDENICVRHGIFLIHSNWVMGERPVPDTIQRVLQQMYSERN